MAAKQTPKRKGISEKVLKAGVASGDAAALFTHLQAIGADEPRGEELITLLRRSGALMNSRPDVATDCLRDAFLAGVRTRLGQIWPDRLADFDEMSVLLQRAEEGYRRILARRGRLAVAAWPGPRIAAALLHIAEHRLTELGEAVAAALARDGMTVPGTINIGEPGGPPVDPDSALHTIVTTLGGTLIMEAHAHRWFDDKGRLNLPSPPSMEEHELGHAGEDEALGRMWGRWRRQEETARFHGGRIDIVEPGSVRADLPTEIDRVLWSPCVEDPYDFMANERFREMAMRGAYDAYTLLRGDERVCGIDQAAPLPPAAFVSEFEVIQGLGLSQRLGYEIISDQETPGGLRLVLWIRGYAALGLWAERRLAQGLDGALLRASDEELMELLQRLAFTELEARHFLSAITFGRGSRDLFDTPLLRVGDGWIVVGPAVTHPDLAKVIPSMLSQRRIQLQRKGHAFNQRVLDLFRDRGLDARTVERQRGGEIFDYDVLVPWGEYIFHFECKNYGLSGNDPVEALHFSQELSSTVAQVQRLRQGLVDHPEILTDEWGPDALSKTLVPCILHNETYALPGDLDGIHVYDFSALSRFFESGAFHIGRDHRLDDGLVVRVQVDARRLWAGAEPTPDDLLAQLRSPFQLELMAPQLDCRSVLFSLDETTAAMHDVLVRQRLSEDELLTALGVDADAAKATFEKAGEQIAKLKAKAPNAAS